jgi:alcohol dehydrogenase
MKDFEIDLIQNIQFGVGSLQRLPEYLKKVDSDRVILVSDRGLESIGVVKKVEDIIVNAGIQCVSYLDVKPNPSVEIVEEAANMMKESGATAIIALGGGSPMDVAKTLGVIAKYGGRITEYEGKGKVPGPIAPLIAIPTTAGTGSEVTNVAVITDESRNYKLTVNSPHLAAKYAILDPELIMTAPASVAAACGVDALIHAIESYISRAATPFTELMAEKAMELIGANIRQFVACRTNEDAACAMMLGSTLAGISFARAAVGNVHAMSHPVSAFFHVPHGVANAVLLPTIIEFNALADNGKYRKIYDYIVEGRKSDDSFVPQMLVEELRKLNDQLGIARGLAEVGVTEDKIPQMAADAILSANIAVNPRQSNVRDLEALYKKAM